MKDCDRWYKSASDNESWTGDFNLIWRTVPEAYGVCGRLLTPQDLSSENRWSRGTATNRLRQAWDTRNQMAGMKEAGRPRQTRATFHVDRQSEPTFDGKPTNDKKRKGSDEGQGTSPKLSKRICWGCDQPGHPAFECILILGETPRKV